MARQQVRSVVKKFTSAEWSALDKRIAAEKQASAAKVAAIKAGKIKPIGPPIPAPIPTVVKS